MMNIIFCILSVFSSPIFSGDFESWYRENHNYFQKEHRDRDLHYQVKIVPKELSAFLDSKKNKTSYKEFKRNVRKRSYFKVKLKISSVYTQTDLLKATSANTAEYNDKLNFISNEFGKCLAVLTTHKDTVYSIDHHHERTYGVSGSLNIVFYFPHSPNIDRIILNDSLFTKQTIVFDFDESIINNIKI